MANVKVAIRVRPLNARESVDGARLAVQVEEKCVRIQNVKLDGRAEGSVDSREKVLEFYFDYCYRSVDPADPHHASQEEVFQDLGMSVLSGASEGYNVCLFAYGQTGSGKTYTMMGTPDSMGLTPRICQGLFRSEDTFSDEQNSSRVEISFLEIYNERVRDLLRGGEEKKRASLRVREHPEKGPYVQDLSQHVVSDCKQAMDLLERGISNRMTAATHNHDASSRSHAIFTIQYTQAILENNLPSETVSKINLVDLAGSERADPHYCKDRLTEGSNINKSLVTLGIVISALAQNSQMSSSCQSINTVASECDGSTVGSHSSSLSAGGGGRRHCFIPYRDSVLTWLLKDSLGGNSKTIMIATVSPSATCYNETLSTLRYAAHARNIVNKPRVNEDAHVRLIRELREEIDRLKSMLLSFEMQRNPSPSLSDEKEGSLSEMVLQNELKVEQLTKDWSESWSDKKELLEQYSVDINRDQAGFLINSLQPHLVSLDRDVLSTEIVFYHLREGVTRIGPQSLFDDPHIVLQGNANCEIDNNGGVVTLKPLLGCVCLLNGREVTKPCRLAQGTVITLDGVHKFRFNHPVEAAVLRERRRASEGGINCTYYDDLIGDGRSEDVEKSAQTGTYVCPSEDLSVRQRVEEKKRFVESLRQEIQAEQRRTEKELEKEQAQLRQQHTEIQQWIVQEKKRLMAVEQRITQDSGVQADLIPIPLLERSSRQFSRDQGVFSGECPSEVVRAKKKAVQEELLKHHTLCRAERRIRRKKLHMQLERIASKRQLLEAKRELQQLEKALPAAEGPESPEQGLRTKLRGRTLVPRRHSFSTDLLSRLHPPHNPVFKHFLRRNQSTEMTSNLSRLDSTGCRKWVSDDCIPRERTQSCSSSVFSGQSPPCPHPLSSPEIRQTPPEQPSTNVCPERPERKPLLPRRDLSFKNKSDQNSAVTLKPLFDRYLAASKENVLAIPTEDSRYKSPKTSFHSEKRGKQSIGSSFSYPVGSKIKTALFKVLKKPPSVVTRVQISKSLRRFARKFQWKQLRGKNCMAKKMSGSKCSIKVAVSCQELEQRTPFENIRQRRWCSTETLMNKTSRWIDRHQGLVGWRTEQEDCDEDASDCESLFSLDSLSSAYATILAEQLRHGELAPSESESEESEMSKDSLTLERNGKWSKIQTQRQTLRPNYSLVTDSNNSSLQPDDTTETRLHLEKSQIPRNLVVPTEASNCQQVSPKKTQMDPSNGATETSLVADARITDCVLKLIDDGGNMQNPSTDSQCSLSRSSTGELELTEAGSSRMHRGLKSFQSKMISSSSPSPISRILSDSQSESTSIISKATNTDDVKVTVQECSAGVPRASQAQTTFSRNDGSCSSDELEQETARQNNVEAKDGTYSYSPARLFSLGKKSCLPPIQSPRMIQDESNLMAADIKFSDNACPATSSQLVKSSLSNPTHQDEVPEINAGTDSLKVSTGTNLPCNVDVGVEKCRYVQQYVSRNSKIVENKATKLFSAVPEEADKLACKNSRKRNKELQDALFGSLKIPKRSQRGDLVTFCCTTGSSKNGFSSNDNMNNDESRSERSISTTDNFKFSSAFNGGSFGENTLLQSINHTSKDTEPSLVCSAQNGIKSSESGNRAGDGINTEKVEVTSKEAFTDTKLFKCNPNDHKKHPESGKAAVYSIINQRISEHLKNCTTLSLLDIKEAKINLNQSLSVLPSFEHLTNHHFCSGDELVSVKQLKNEKLQQDQEESDLSVCISGEMMTKKSSGSQCEVQTQSVIKRESSKMKYTEEEKDSKSYLVLNSQTESKNSDVPTLQDNSTEKNVFFPDLNVKSHLIPHNSLFLKKTDNQTCLDTRSLQISNETAFPSKDSFFDNAVVKSLFISNPGIGSTSEKISQQSQEKCPATSGPLKKSYISVQCKTNHISIIPADASGGDRLMDPFGFLQTSSEKFCETGSNSQCKLVQVKTNCKGSSVIKSETMTLFNGIQQPNPSLLEESRSKGLHSSVEEFKMSEKISIKNERGFQNVMTNVAMADGTVDNSAVTSKNITPKRVRRPAIRACSTSSTDSSFKSSDEDVEDKNSSRVQHTKLRSKCLKAGAHQYNKQEYKQSNVADNLPHKSKITTSGKLAQYLTPCLYRQGASEQTEIKTNETDCPPKAYDSPIRFASSDINPFVHQWHGNDLSQHCIRSPAFGSAADLTSKSPLLKSSERLIERCCSVDNGLDGQDSPFHSHLSTYVANKGLSSTLSSIEDYKVHGTKTSQLAQPETLLRHNRAKSTNTNCSCNNNKSSFSNNSSQVDEIMLVYSSEQESQTNKKQLERRTCEHETQTELEFQNGRVITSSCALKKNDRHKRSKTDGVPSQRVKADIDKSPTWASMESMSAHLSKLIDSTSDLLGDVQGMRTGEISKSSPRRSSINCSKHDNFDLESSCPMISCSTQTAVNVGIQTKGLRIAAKKDNRSLQTSRDVSRQHEINLMVKVIGSEVIDISQNNEHSGGKAKACSEEKNHCMANSRGGIEEHDLHVSTCVKTASVQQRHETSTSLQSSKQSLSPPSGITTQDVTHKSYRHHLKNQKSLSATCSKKAFYTDRASSPILTVRTRLPMKHNNEHAFGSLEKLKSESLMLKELSHSSYSSIKGSDQDSVSLSSSLDRHVDMDRRNQNCLDRSSGQARNSSSKHCLISKKPILFSTHVENQRTTKLIPHSDDSEQFGTYSSNLFISDTTRHCPEDDALSLPPSECNTDVLVSIDPITIVHPLQDNQKVPEDLPLHNKFTNWSGVNQSQNQREMGVLRTEDQNIRWNCEWAEMESFGSAVESLSQSGQRAKEIKKLQRDREQVMATVNHNPNPTPLSVELTEAKLHYGLGETNALLKMLCPRSMEGLEPGTTTPRKQKLYNWHRRSIEGLKQEREERLQKCRRARSLSPSEHHQCSPSDARPSITTPAATPRNSQEHRQRLHPELINSSSRIPEESHYPSDIEQLLRDYSRAREEAQTEIAKARDRLRERTEMEKRRFQPQDHTQQARDELRGRTRTSSSTLCTGSSLSLSSGPTSGYNSGNVSRPHQGIGGQINELNKGLKPRTHPSICSFDRVKTPKTWLSDQDVNQNCPVSGKFDPLMISSPSACQRNPTASSEQSSQLSTTYQEISSSLLSRALAEVQLASSGDLANLVMGKASAGWRYQGEERGIQAYYKSSSSPSVHSFLGVGELDRPLDSLWSVIRQLSNSHMYNPSIRSMWTRPLDDSTQLAYILSDPSTCHLSQPRDFCCISTESKQGGLCVLAIQSVLEETLPRPSLDAIRGEIMPSCWMLQPVGRDGQGATRVIYLLQLDLVSPSFPHRLLNTVARRQAAVIADLDVFLAS